MFIDLKNQEWVKINTLLKMYKLFYEIYLEVFEIWKWYTYLKI